MADSSLFDVVAGSDADGTRDRLDAGSELLLVAQVASDAIEAVDVDELRAGGGLEEALDAEHLGAALGRPAGHLLVRRTVGVDADEGLAVAVAREAAGRAGARAARVAVERFDFASS